MASARNRLSSTVGNLESPSVGRLTIDSYNLYGLNQGIVGVHELMHSRSLSYNDSGTSVVIRQPFQIVTYFERVFCIQFFRYGRLS